MATESPLSEFVRRGYRLGGVVHVGANDGEEIVWYAENGLTPILCFEPHPAAYERLRARYRDAQALPLRIANTALGAETGMLKLYVPADGDDEKTSSRLAVPTDGHDWTRVPVGDQIVLPVTRFDEWCQANHCDITVYDTLVVDVQGMEAEVLDGMGDLLINFEFLCVELSAKPMYVGEAEAQTIVDSLARKGYVRITDIREHDDVLFIKEWLT
jgi:FkbM family methyltransferase